VTSGAEVDAVVEQYLKPLKEAAIDVLIMGCTHYPFLRAAIQQYLGSEVQLLDPAQETVARARTILAEQQLLALSGTKPIRRFVASGDPGLFRQGGSIFLPDQMMTVEQVIL
jgi:glutamate racemase